MPVESEGWLPGLSARSTSTAEPSTPRPRLTCAESSIERAARDQSVGFVLQGAWVKKFRRGGKAGLHSVFMRMLPEAAGPTIAWGNGRQERIGAVDGGLFGDDFQGDGFFDAHQAEEALCFSMQLESRTLYLLALSEAEKQQWVRGVDVLINNWGRASVEEQREQQSVREQPTPSDAASASSRRSRFSFASGRGERSSSVRASLSRLSSGLSLASSSKASSLGGASEGASSSGHGEGSAPPRKSRRSSWADGLPLFLSTRGNNGRQRGLSSGGRRTSAPATPVVRVVASRGEEGARDGSAERPSAVRRAATSASLAADALPQPRVRRGNSLDEFQFQAAIRALELSQASVGALPNGATPGPGRRLSVGAEI